MMDLIKSLIFLSVGEADIVEKKVMILHSQIYLYVKWFMKTNPFIDRQQTIRQERNWLGLC